MPGAAALLLLVAFPLSAPAAEIAPHRAIYSLQAGDLAPDAPVSAVSGEMLFIWDESCRGWQVQQIHRMIYSGPEGGGLATTSEFSSIEAQDGSSFTFLTRHFTGDRVDDVFGGDAQRAAAGGEANWNVPDARTRPLPEGTLFPSGHTVALIDAAQAGETTLVAPVFDGTDEEGLSLVSAVIGRALEAPEDSAFGPLDERPGWRIAMAFFETGAEDAAPQMEIAMELLDNGVVRSMDIAYERFSITARLEALEPIADAGC